MATATNPKDDPGIPANVVPETDGEIPVAEVYEEESAEAEANPKRRFIFFQAAPAWLVSTVLHVLILLVLGLISVADPIKVINVLTANSTGEEGPEIEEFTIEEMDPGDVAEMEEMAEPMTELSELTETMEVVQPEAVAPMELAVEALDMSQLAAEMAPAMTSMQSLSQMSSQSLSSRSQDMKKKLLRDYGGNASSEAAVTEALKWFSRHQMANGGWTFAHNLVCNGRCGDPGDPNRADDYSGATSLALLPFLGAGQTHTQGEFRDVVLRGLRFLVQVGKQGKQGGVPVLDLRTGGNMYSHGLAAITLCEAYAMTEDPELYAPAQAAVNFIAYAQGRDGGWRYGIKDVQGDTSVVGWQIMALKSAYMGHLQVSPRTIQGSVMFLDRVQSNNGSIYGYTKPDTRFRPGTSAIGLLCRMYTGWDKTHPGIVEGVGLLGKAGVDKQDIYYNYYAAQVLRQYGGAQWDKFNVELRDWLVAEQSQDSGAKGSWHFPKSRSHRGPKEGGRLASTAFSTMILEVYYRHMPLYADAAAEDDFPL